MKTQAMFQPCPKCGRIKNARAKTCGLCAGKGRKNKPAELVTLTCKNPNCKEKFQIPKWRFNQGRGSFHSKKCHDEYLKTIRGSDHIKYNGGADHPRHYSGTSWKKARQVALNRAGGKCEWCGISLKKVKRFGVHHIIEAWKFPEIEKSHTIDNLAVICQSCHAKHHGLGKIPKRKAGDVHA